MSGRVRFRVVIDGEISPGFMADLLDRVRDVTPEDGGFTIAVGTAVEDAP